jgi:DNA-binding NtrC family response regulator
VTAHILIIEDDAVLGRMIARQLVDQGYVVTNVGTLREAADYLAQHEPHLVITDMRLPDGDTLERLPDLVKAQPVILLTAFGSVRSAVAAMKAGAFEYLMKPASPDELSLVVQRALELTALRRDHQFCRRRLRAKEESASFMIGVSAALLRVKETITAVGPSDINVLIQGESGAGKELVARAVHEASDRSRRNFVAVDCCTLQEKLFESELFGHERGAFTGADRQKRGLIEEAEGGTLFLDEIGEIEPAIQAKLLRVLETGVFRRLGGNKYLRANVRVVAATNRNLAAMSRDGGFRPDLYYRLSTFVIEVPPLRTRRDDIPYLATHFIQHHNFSRRINKRLASETVRRLTAYDWPGNVRELRNVIERAIILSRDGNNIRPEHLAFGEGEVDGVEVTLSFGRDPTLAELEAEYLRMQLAKHSGHRARVAEVLAVSERNIYRLIQRYGLSETTRTEAAAPAQRLPARAAGLNLKGDDA